MRGASAFLLLVWERVWQWWNGERDSELVRETREYLAREWYSRAQSRPYDQEQEEKKW